METQVSIRDLLKLVDFPRSQMELLFSKYSYSVYFGPVLISSAYLNVGYKVISHFQIFWQMSNILLWAKFPP